MAKTKTKTVTSTEKDIPEKNINETLKDFIKAQSPSIFEKEPTPAYAEGNLNKFVEGIVNLLS